ncbi:MAG: helix-turn-helix domain-containing protein [Solobacterium sp.]|nr:helix-turn-helix domain-containing protein [Solobacterium sp.]
MIMADNSAYRQRKRVFKNSCRIYINEKSHLLALEKKYPFLKNEPATEDSAILHVGIFSDLNEAQRIIYSYKHIKENTEYVDSVFTDIESKCGSDAKSILWKLYVEGSTQEIVAVEYGVGKRTIQRWVKQWLDQEFKPV